MIALIIAGFLLVMALAAFRIIRVVPDDCRFLVLRRGRIIVRKPGLDFLIPFLDQPLGYVHVVYRNLLLCEFSCGDETFLIFSTAEVIDEDRLSLDTPDTFVGVPDVVGQVVRKKIDPAWEPGSDQELAAAAEKICQESNERLSKDNIVLKDMVIRHAPPGDPEAAPGQ